ncbi:MAG: hypothetical protein IJ973_01005, partial [Christensenellaceae bacterium]|nr:hypothetical protein [Christensenellaceae bacterium]
VPFDSGRKMMSTVHKTESGALIQFTKGAPDELLKRCTKALFGHGNPQSKTLFHVVKGAVSLFLFLFSDDAQKVNFAICGLCAEFFIA